MKPSEISDPELLGKMWASMEPMRVRKPTLRQWYYGLPLHGIVAFVVISAALAGAVSLLFAGLDWLDSLRY